MKTFFPRKGDFVQASNRRVGRVVLVRRVRACGISLGIRAVLVRFKTRDVALAPESLAPAGRAVVLNEFGGVQWRRERIWQVVKKPDAGVQP